MNASLCCFCAYFLDLAPLGESLFLRPIVRTRFQFVLFADVTIEVNDFLLRLAFLRHASLTGSEQMKRTLLNIDARNKNTITVLNPYGDDAPLLRQYRSSPQEGQNQRQVRNRKKGRKK
jgi:hypothetical protein